MLLKLCRCGKLIEQSEKYCEACSKIVTDRHKEYNKYRRNKKHNKFYYSSEWLKVRTQALQRFNYIDIYQYYINNKVVKAEMVHHIIELEDDWNKRLDIDNLIPLSNSTHNTVIRSLYNKDNLTKKKTQELLYNLIKKYQKEVGGY